MPKVRSRRAMELARAARRRYGGRGGRRWRPPDQDRGPELSPDRIIWIFGSSRTGSTWLSSMMGEVESHAVWQEPLVGALFGDLYYLRAASRTNRQSSDFILGTRYKGTWLAHIRAMVLEGADARFPSARAGYLVVKEPNGSIGAPLLMEALPESRMVLLVRDPRDVVASSMDARHGDSWAALGRDRRARSTLRDRKPDAYVEKRAEALVKQFGNAMDAYRSHRGPKVLLRYEELRADPVGTLARLYSTLDIPVAEADLGRAVETHAWENLADDEKGSGRFYRKATPGAWRDDLTAEQAAIVARVTAPVLEELYPDAVGS